jgi:hypothetical protein
MNKRNLIIIGLFLLVLVTIPALVEARTLMPSSYVNRLGKLYEDYYSVFDFVIFGALFAAIANMGMGAIQSGTGNNARHSRIIGVLFGIIGGVSIVYFELKTGFKLGDLSPMFMLAFFALLAALFMKWAANFAGGEHKGVMFATSWILMWNCYQALSRSWGTNGIGRFRDLFQQLDGIGDIAQLLAAIYLGYKFIHKVSGLNVGGTAADIAKIPRNFKNGFNLEPASKDARRRIKQLNKELDGNRIEVQREEDKFDALRRSNHANLNTLQEINQVLNELGTSETQYNNILATLNRVDTEIEALRTGGGAYEDNTTQRKYNELVENHNKLKSRAEALLHQIETLRNTAVAKLASLETALHRQQEADGDAFVKQRRDKARRKYEKKEDSVALKEVMDLMRAEEVAIARAEKQMRNPDPTIKETGKDTYNRIYEKYREHAKGKADLELMAKHFTADIELDRKMEVIEQEINRLEGRGVDIIKEMKSFVKPRRDKHGAIKNALTDVEKDRFLRRFQELTANIDAKLLELEETRAQNQ